MQRIEDLFAFAIVVSFVRMHLDIVSRFLVRDESVSGLFITESDRTGWMS